MKNKFLTIVLFTILQTTFSQNTTNEDVTFNKNEFKINAGYLIGGIFEITYEGNINKNTSFGVSFLVPYDEDIDDIKFMINPFSRIFFGKKPAQGFFIEINGAIASIENTTYTYNPNTFGSNSKTEQTTNIGLGIAVGGKFVLNESFVVDVYGGLGRFLNSEKGDIQAYPRLGVNLGYRF
jgi:hypothetical protein